jgi:putative intracellular protease/amidase
VQIAIPLFDDLTALDAIGPYEVLSRLPGAEVVFVGAEARPYVSDNGMLRMHADATLDDVPAPDIVCVPGGVGVRRELDGPIVSWVRAAHASSRWTTSVCTGSLLLGAAGVLDGLEATSHWLDIDELERYGARPTSCRVVEQGKVVTAAGVSSGIDMGLVLAAKIAGNEVAQAIQLGIEYDPQPPFHAGSPQTAPAHIVEGLRVRMRERLAATRS